MRECPIERFAPFESASERLQTSPQSATRSLVGQRPQPGRERQASLRQASDFCAQLRGVGG
jgi:hypothetical protein